MSEKRMKKWKYLNTGWDFEDSIKGPDFKQWLAKKGRDGWELVNAHDVHGDAMAYRCLFKRPA